MKGIDRRVYYSVSLFLLITIILSTVYYSKEKPIWITHEVSATGTDPLSSTGMVSSPVKKFTNKLPYTFQAGKVNSLTIHTPRIFTKPLRGTILIGFTSTRPVDFIVTSSKEAVWGFSDNYPPNTDLLINLSNVYFHYEAIELDEERIISFCFKSDETKLSQIKLQGFRASAFYQLAKTRDVAVETARMFLQLNDVEVGKYLQQTAEYGTPNYYWHNVFGIKHPINTSPCQYTAIRFEQAKKPGHFFEVWVEKETNQIVGGDMCR